AEFSQGIELPHCSAYNAYKTLLKGLLLKEFPCGLGEWREDYDLIQSEVTKARSKGQRLGTVKPNLIDYASSVTLKDVNAAAERIETLSELTKAKESPWCQTCDWTDEGGRLRELAIAEPWTLTQKRVNSLLRTLKMHDKNVDEIDKDMKRLTNLEELVLSANYLTWIDGQNLPPTLKVLELHGNFVEDLAGLLPKPPPLLEHLGIGRNNLAFIGEHLNGVYWPCLLSLDLSFNHLDDLKSLLESLSSLPKLRSLVLAGNPLALTPWYRGYTIDQLKKLLSLDDSKVTADERHFYRGMVRRREFVQEQCQLQLKVHSLKNLPIPPEILSPDDFPEYPLIVRKYYVRFWLPFEDKEAAAATAESEAEDEAEDDEADEAGGLSGNDRLRKSTGFMSDIPEEPTDEQQRMSASVTGPRPGCTASGAAEASRSINGTLCQPVCSNQRSYSELTTATPQADPAATAASLGQMNWEGQLTCGNLKEMRDFLMHGVQVEIMEDKTLLYPPDQLPQEGQEPKLGQDKKKEEKKDDGKPKKKKKIDESSLVVHSIESTPLVSLTVDLSDLLTSAGQRISLDLRSQPPQTPPATVPSTPANAEKKPKDKPKDDKKKEKAAKTGSAKPTGAKAGGKGGGAKDGAIDEGEVAPAPPPVESRVEFLRVQWRSVKDCPTAVVIAVDQK
ncbi:hypothetical protein BOX15_Mlig034003g3, partial [Macrostomum lignano]